MKTLAAITQIVVHIIAIAILATVAVLLAGPRLLLWLISGGRR